MAVWRPPPEALSAGLVTSPWYSPPGGLIPKRDRLVPALAVQPPPATHGETCGRPCTGSDPRAATLVRGANGHRWLDAGGGRVYLLEVVILAVLV